MSIVSFFSGRQSQWVPNVLKFTLSCRRETICLFWSTSHICLFSVPTNCKLCRSLHSLSLPPPSPLSPPHLSSPPLLHSGSLLMDHRPLGPPTFLGSCCLEILMDLDRHTLGSAGSLLSSNLACGPLLKVFPDSPSPISCHSLSCSVK